METLFVVGHHQHHRSQYYNRCRVDGPGRFGSFGSRGFGGINCRSFQSGAGILPTPFKSCSTPVTQRASSFSSPKLVPNDNTNSKRSVKSSAIPIPINIKRDFNKEGSFDDDFCYSELWAGPAYSNSPPPSSLPIPTFSLRSNRTVSLDLPSSPPVVDFHPVAKSAPPSPTRDRNHNPISSVHGSDSATKTLRRILNLDVADE